MIENPNSKGHNMEKMVLFWRDHPVQAAEDILGVKLDKPQRIILRNRWKHDTEYDIFSRGCGKCVSPDTLVFTGQGVIPIGEIARCEPGKSISINLEVFGPHGKTMATEWYNDGEQDGFHITTDYGYEVKGTKAHKVLCWDTTGYVEKTLSEITEGDIVIVPRQVNLFGSTTTISYEAPTQLGSGARWASHQLPTVLDEDLSYFLGLLVGDGTCGYRDWVGFTSGDDELIQVFRHLCQKIFGVKASNVTQGEKCPTWKLCSIPVRQFLVAIGLEMVGAREKRIPSCIMKAPASCIAAFLRGLFDTDGTADKRGMVCYGTSSHRLGREVQVVLTGLGIISDRRYKPKVDAWEIEISSDAADIFADSIGFGLSRKRLALMEHSDITRNPNKDVVPHLGGLLKAIKERAKETGIIISQTVPGHQKLYSYISGHYLPTYPSLKRIVDSLAGLKGFSPYDTLAKLVKDKPFFDVVTTKTVYRGEFCDLVVPDGHLFAANGMWQHNTFMNAVSASLRAMLYPGHRVGLIGPSFRQSKMMFNEVEKLYERSPMFQEACVRPPARQPESCYIKFKAAPGRSGSWIEALPLGSDGSKIRGARFFDVYADEIAMIDPQVLNVVVKGFLATSPNPMDRVEFLKAQMEKVRRGEISEADIELPNNKFIGSGTAFYQWNHFWDRINKIQVDINDRYKLAKRRNEDVSRFVLEGGPLNGGQMLHRVISDGKMCICAFPYTDMSPGFLNLESIEANKIEMSHYQWLMEYCCFFPPDSEGFFRRSMLDAARAHGEFGPQLKPRQGCLYALGIDPARSSDNFAMALFEVEPGMMIRLVRIYTWNHKNFPDMHLNVRKVIREYNVKWIKMDSGGGGTTIRDLLARKDMCPAGDKVILENDFEEHRGLLGERILAPLCQFSNYQWVHDANFNLLSGLQHGKLQIAAVPPVGGQLYTASEIETLEAEDKQIEEALNEMSSIIVTPIGGRMRWDTPSKTMRKDRYSAIMMGFDAARELMEMHAKPKTLAWGGWG